MAKFRVTLADEERCLLWKMVSSGKGAARQWLHGRLWLQADASPEGMGSTAEAIAEVLGVSLSPLHRVRQQCVAESFAPALHPRPPRKRPDKGTNHRGGRTAVERLGLRRAAARTRALDGAFARGSAGGVGIGGTGLPRNRTPGGKKNARKRWQGKTWWLPPTAHADFVYPMEDGLRVEQL